MNLLILFALGGVFILLSCETKVFTGDVDCDDSCFTQKPDNVDLIFHWTMENNQDTITVHINRGTIEDGEYVGSWDLNSNPATVTVKAGEKYSCEARYERDGKTFWVVDGTEPKIKQVVDYCPQGDCWVVENADLYVELKY